jgi:threonine/homoserine/homoserine lactone efflux protein
VGELAAFLGIAILVIVTPGQDTALTIRSALLGGRRAGIATSAGVAAGQACWTVAASAGLAALLVASEPVFVALKLVGAAYLVYLGLQALRHALRRVAETVGRTAGSPLVPARAFRQGLLSNLGNPKMAVFFTSLLPQFGSSFWSLLALGLLFCSLTFAWLSAYSVAVARAGDLLRRPRIRRPLDAVTGTLLVAFGIRLASEGRP